MVNAGMVDISEKDVTRRAAKACALVRFSPEAMKALMNKESPKGDVFETARVAGVMAAKATSSILPLCHPLALTKVSLDFQVDEARFTVCVESEVFCMGKTGVEMEALTSASVAALTIYDMMKWKDKSIEIDGIRLLSKSGGKSGDYFRT